MCSVVDLEGRNHLKWLERPNKPKAPLPPTVEKQDAETESSLRADIESGMSDPSTPPAGPSLLLSLPRELRDLIYEYALTEEGGLVAMDMDPYDEGGITTTRFRAAKNTRPRNASELEHNNLRLVSRQLHQETCGLGFKFNDLVFQPYNLEDVPSTTKFSTFLEYFCSEYHQQRIRKVIVKESKINKPSYHFGDPFLNPLLKRFTKGTIREFCDAHPRCIVEIRIDHFPSDRSDRLGSNFESSIQRILHSTTPPCLPTPQGHILPSNVRIVRVLDPTDDEFSAKTTAKSALPSSPNMAYAMMVPLRIIPDTEAPKRQGISRWIADLDG